MDSAYAGPALLQRHCGVSFGQNGALGADAEEYKIRKQLIENQKIEAIIVLPREMFYATDISVTLWIVGNHKKSKKVKREGQEIVLRDRENEILFIDARTLGDGGANEDRYVGFTGTPIDATLHVFGEVVVQYTKKQSLDDGSTVGIARPPRGTVRREDGPGLR